jgi:alkylhydroperoxidase family enzyme
VTEDQIAELSNYQDSDAFDELQKAVLDYAVALTTTPDSATDELVDTLRRSLDEK